MTAFRTLLTILFLTSQTLWAAPGKLQNTDFKTPAQLTAAGAPLSQLLNDSKIWVTANGINQQLSSAIQSGLIGGGAGQNLVSNGNFEASGVAGWSTFQTTLAAAPSLAPTTAPATCSSCTFAIGAQTSGALDGQTSLQLTGAATTTAGQGFISNAFTVAPAFRGQVMSIKGVFGVVSGLAALNLSGTSSNSFAVYIYDVTNAAWIQPNGTYGLASNGGQFAPISFQVPSNTAQLQLAIVNVNALAAATVQLFDDLTVAPAIGGYGIAARDYRVTGTTVITGTGGNPTKGSIANDSIGYAQLGDSAHVIGSFKQTAASSSAGTGDMLIQLPAGLSFDSNKVTFFTPVIGGNASMQNPPMTFGTATIISGTTYALGVVVPYDATHFRLFLIQDYANGSTNNIGVFSANYFALNGGALSLTFDFTAPIAGWSSNVTQSSDFDGRNVNFTGFSASGSVTSNVAIALTAQPGQDKAGAWNGSTYVVQAAGDYLVSGSGVFATAGPALTVYLNGSIAPTNPYFSTISAANAISAGSTLLQNLKVGDQITLRLAANSNYANLNFSVMRMPGSSPVIQAAQSVVAIYGLTAQQGLAANSPIKYDTRVKDSTLSYSTVTGLFTVPTSGTYRIQVVSSATASAGSMFVRRNSTAIGYISQNNTGVWSGGLSYPFLAGDTVSIVPDTNNTAAGINGTNFVNQVTFERTGN